MHDLDMRHRAELLMEPGNETVVQLDDHEPACPRSEFPREMPQSRADLEHLVRGTDLRCVNDPPEIVRVREKVLAEGSFRVYMHILLKWPYCSTPESADQLL
jgi:hypothetical protein